MLLDWTTTGWESQVRIYASRSYLYVNWVSVILKLIQGFYSGNSGFSPLISTIACMYLKRKECLTSCQSEAFMHYVILTQNIQQNYDGPLQTCTYVNWLNILLYSPLFIFSSFFFFLSVFLGCLMTWPILVYFSSQRDRYGTLSCAFDILVDYIHEEWHCDPLWLMKRQLKSVMNPRVRWCLPFSFN